MRVLVTGSRGLVGTAVIEALLQAGHDPVGYDILDSLDILDPRALQDTMSGCTGVVHTAARMHDDQESADHLLQVNVVGTWNVLSAAVDSRVSVVVHLSSVDALGVFKGERAPDYLPLDHDHRCYPTTPYGISKYLSEELCRSVAARTGLWVIALRPPGVWTSETYSQIVEARSQDASYEWSPYWEYGAFIDHRDLARICVAALDCRLPGYRNLLVSSSDITTSGRTSADLSSFVHPGVEWRGGVEYDMDPYHALLDIKPAMQAFDWRPVHTWREFVAGPPAHPPDSTVGRL